MAAPTTTFSPPRMDCACGASIDLGGRAVGDSVHCPSCQALRVVIRSKVTGDLPAAVEAGALSPADQAEVEQALHRIKLRRVGHATRHVSLYPAWAIFVAGVQFYLSGILAGQNLIALGQETRGKRVQVTAVVTYLVLGAAILALTFLGGRAIPRALILVPALLIPLGFAFYYTSIQNAPSAAAREAGAQTTSVVLPLLLGLILAIAQAFAVWFLELQVNGPW